MNASVRDKNTQKKGNINRIERRAWRLTEVAEMLGVCRSKAYEMAEKGELPGVIRFGRSVRVNATAFDDWLKGGGKQPATR